MVKLPEAADVQEVRIRRDPGVSVPSPGPSGLGELGAAINEVGTRFQAANDARVLSNLNTKSIQAVSDFKSELESDPDSFETWEQKYKEFVDKHRQEVKKTANRNVYDAWERSFNSVDLKTRSEILGNARETMIDKGLTELKTNLEGIQNIAINSDKDKRDILLAQADLIIEEHQNTGFIKDSTAQDLRDKFRSGMERARFENAVAIDPELAKESLDMGDFDVSETDRPKWNRYVDSAIKSQKDQARIAAERAKRELEEAEKLAKEQTELDFITRLDSEDPPTIQEINQSNLDANHKLQWRKMLKDTAKSGYKLNEEVYAGLTVAVNGGGEYNGAIVTKDTILEYGRSGDLTPQATEHLLDRWDKVNNPATKKDSIRENSKKLAVNMLNTYKKNGMFSEDLTENTVTHARAVDEVVKWADANPEGDPIDYVVKNLEPQIKTAWWERLLSRMGQSLFSGIPGRIDPTESVLPAPAQEGATRQEAIKFLRGRRKLVSEQTIGQAIEYLNANRS